MVSITVFKGSEGGKIVKSTTEKQVGPRDVVIKVTHSGLCGTDVHYKGADIVLGHEGAGVVEEVGKDVTMFKKGDRAGWGYNHGSCGHCKQCLDGYDTFCPQRELYGEAHLDQGSMASHGVWNEDFLFKIPDAIDNVYAAPLQCGGATVYNALSNHGLRSGQRVGVIGVGGLGHLAIQFAAKMGCEVVVFSGSNSKEEEAKKLGAREFYAMKGVKSADEVKCTPVDHLVVTTSALPDWKLYLPMVERRGVIYPLSVSFDDMAFPSLPVIQSGIRIQGSLVADRGTHNRMLEFAAYHDIKPMVNEFKMDEAGIEKAFETLANGDMKYRGVLVAQ